MAQALYPVQTFFRPQLLPPLLATALFLLLTAQPSMAASGAWTTVTTTNFVLYSCGAQEQNVHLLETLEQARSFFARTTFATALPQSPVKVIAFTDAEEYRRYQPGPGAYAFYQPARDADYIVLQDLNPEHDRVALHEYAHSVIRHTYAKLPLWLDEGLADVYSSVEVQRERFFLGRTLPDRAWALENLSPLSLETMFSADRSSPYYRGGEKSSRFYARAWLFTHMLALGPAYSARFPAFVVALSAGQTSQQALRTAYGKEVNQLEEELEAYSAKLELPSVQFDAAPVSSIEPRVSVPSRIEIELTLARLLASNPEKQSDAKQSLARLAQEYPHHPAVHELLAHMALEQNQIADAQPHLAAAVTSGSTDPELMYWYARAQSDAGAPPAQVIQLLERILAIQPDNYYARLLLGCEAVKIGDCQLAISTLEGIKNIDPKDSFVFFATMAYCHVRAGDLQSGESYASQAQAHAQTSSQESQANDLLAYIHGERNLLARAGTRSALR